MNAPRTPTASSLRKLLDQVLPLPSDLDAFLVDCYPDVHRLLSAGMDRKQRVSKLFESRPTTDVLDSLRTSYPEQVSTHEHLLAPDLGRRTLKDEFELFEVFHEGTMSRLYRAWQRTTKLWRAVKELKVPLPDERSRQRFMQEVDILGKLQTSEHVVRIVDADVDDRHTPWLAMELLVGESLADYLRRVGPLGWDETYTLLSDICKALSLAHKHQPAIVHRDIKPENIFLQKNADLAEQPSGAPYHVKLLDFGLAKVMWESRPALSSRGGIGTYLWMAPEQFEDDVQISPATDVWALGLLTFTMVTGFHYFPAGNLTKLSMGAIVAQILREPLVTARERARELGAKVQLSEGFDHWFSRCVNRDLAGRHPSARELMAAFKTTVHRPSRSPTGPHTRVDSTAAPLGAASPARPQLVSIPAGHFQMGSSPAEEPQRWLDEAERRVHIAEPFLLAQTPVTQAQYELVIGINPAAFKGDPQRPIENVSLLDALRYCNELSKREALEPCYQFEGNQVVLRSGIRPERAGYRLPTEAEWEYAARANHRQRYPGADQADAVAWYEANSHGSTQPVEQKQPNAWSLFDLAGNVFEWVWAPYIADQLAASPEVPLSCELTEEFVVRGGSWASSLDMLRPSHRLPVPADWKTNYIGFRIARTRG